MICMAAVVSFASLLLRVTFCATADLITLKNLAVVRSMYYLLGSRFEIFYSTIGRVIFVGSK